ncbi:MAG TPA: response regulator transcription factor [Nitrospiraceae bacterium]|nr:response regulator transcription factor [Nitrospiraceae bacterium]
MSIKRILVVDDHAILRQGLKQVLAEEFSDAVIEETGTGQGALEKLRSQRWDLMIADINLPDRSGLDVIKEAKAAQPLLPVIVLSIYPEDQYAVRALKAGAAAYLNKEAAPDELVNAVKTVTQGRRYMSPRLAREMAKNAAEEPAAPPHATLSDREFQVLSLIAKGKTLKEVAETLGLSSKTVSTYRARLMAKLSLPTTASLIRYAVEQRLVE